MLFKKKKNHLLNGDKSIDMITINMMVSLNGLPMVGPEVMDFTTTIMNFSD